MHQTINCSEAEESLFSLNQEETISLVASRIVAKVNFFRLINAILGVADARIVVLPIPVGLLPSCRSQWNYCRLADPQWD